MKVGNGGGRVESSEVKGVDNDWELSGVKSWEENQPVVKDEGITAGETGLGEGWVTDQTCFVRFSVECLKAGYFQ